MFVAVPCTVIFVGIIAFLSKETDKTKAHEADDNETFDMED